MQLFSIQRQFTVALLTESMNVVIQFWFLNIFFLTSFLKHEMTHDFGVAVWLSNIKFSRAAAINHGIKLQHVLSLFKGILPFFWKRLILQKDSFISWHEL